jgi:hypothetical protein|tara:strand:+ start:55 stop:246 length:192 start_codon:yes stop_codon:yes gene_type:complete
MTDLNNIKQGQKITFNFEGKIYTKKVKTAFIKFSVNTKAYNVSSIGTGTQLECIDHKDVISVK